MVTCPKCNGPMYDNRKTKKNAKQPDFKCKNKDGCDHAIWPDSKDYPKNLDAAPNGNAAGIVKSAQVVPAVDAGTYLKRAGSLLKQAHAAARNALADDYSGEDGRTLFIELNKAQRDGYVTTSPNKAAAAPVEAEPVSGSADLENGEGIDL